MLYSHVIYSGDRKGVSYLKKQCLILSLLLVLVLVIPAQAQTPRINTDKATLTFSGTTAYCRVRISAKLNEDISATIKLWDGSQYIETWQENATSSLNFSESVPVQRGRSYTLTVDYSVAGKPMPSLSSSGTCQAALVFCQLSKQIHQYCLSQDKCNQCSYPGILIYKIFFRKQCPNSESSNVYNYEENRKGDKVIILCSPLMQTETQLKRTLQIIK